MFDIEHPGRPSSGACEGQVVSLGTLAMHAERLFGLVGTILSGVGWRPAGAIGSVTSIACLLLPALVAVVRRVRKVRPGVDDPKR